jgi:hypothetical protein
MQQIFVEFIDFVSLFCECAGTYKESGLGMFRNNWVFVE